MYTYVKYLARKHEEFSSDQVQWCLSITPALGRAHHCLCQPPHPQDPLPLAFADTLTQKHLSLLHSHSLGHCSLLNQSFPSRQLMVCVRHCHFLLPRSWTNRLRTYCIICFSEKSALACTLCWFLTLQSPCLCLSSEHTRTMLLCEPSF